ncbi:hypothetical protein BGW80DRAFT_1449327 [Lactifluus volemus]|nr:hypothetical protein BGW80DRAFT_1449327 [Lactifluus volemus]
MQREFHTLGTPHQFDPLQTAQANSPVSFPDHQYSSDARVPSATFTSSPVAGLGQQYAYQGNQSVAHRFPPPGTAQHTFYPPIIPGPVRPEYYAPLAYPQILNDDTIGQPPNVAGPSQGIPGQVLPGMSAGEELRQLASRYLHDRDSRIDKVRVRRSRRSGKVKVMILLELDDME